MQRNICRRESRSPSPAGFRQLLISWDCMRHGRIQTGSYTNRDGQKVYTTDVVVEEQEFVESKGASAARPPKRKTEPETDDDGFMNIPEGVEDEIPFR